MKISGFILVVFSILLPQSAYQILELPLTAYGLSMTNGGSSISTAQTTTNPAAFDPISTSIDFNYLRFPADIYGAGLALAKAGSRHTYGAALSILDYGTFVDNGSDLSFSAKDILISGRWKSTLWNSFSLGF